MTSINHRNHDDKHLRFSPKRSTLIFLVLVALGTMAFIPTHNLPYHYLINAAMNALHFPAGVLLCSLLTTLFTYLPKWISRYRWLAILFSFSILIAIELVQPLVGRTRSYEDLLWGASGVLIAFAYLTLHPFRQIVIALALVLMSFSTIPLVSHATNLYRLHQRMPILTTFSEDQDIDFWEPASQERFFLKTTEDGADRFLRTEIKHSGWSGVTFVNPDIDWSMFTQLCFKSRLSNSAELHTRIDDRASHDYQTRFHAQFSISTQWQSFCVPLLHIRNPSGDRLLTNSIVRVVFFVAGQNDALILDLDDLVLRP